MDKTNLLIYKSWIEAAIIKMRIKTKGLKKYWEQFQNYKLNAIKVQQHYF